MIDTLYIANFIEGQLNANSLGKHFLVFADEGEMRNAKRCCEYKYWTNCLLESISSSITPIKNMSFQTETVQVMFIVDLAEAGQTKVGAQDREQSNNLIDVKTCIYEMIERLNGTTQTQSIDSKSYTVTLGFGSPTDGQKTQLGEVSEALPIYLNITMSFFQNGVNANDCHVYVNGEDLYFTRCVISKVNTADQNQFAGDAGGSKAYMLNGGKSIDLILPTVSTTVGTMIMEDILEVNKNEAISVGVVTPLYSKYFIGTFGNNSVSMDAGANLGYNVSIVEGKENLLKYETGRWVSVTLDEEQVEPSISMGNPQIEGWGVIVYNDDFCVHWGDGAATPQHDLLAWHSYTDSKTKHNIKIFKTKPTSVGYVYIKWVGSINGVPEQELMDIYANIGG